MNIWIVNHYALPPTEVGGTRHYALARELIARGHNVTLIASNFNHASRQAIAATQRTGLRHEVVAGVPFLWLPTPPYSGNTVARMWNMLVFAGRVWSGQGMRRCERPDVIIGSIAHLFGAFAAERLAQRLRVPFVLEVRDLWPQTLIDMKLMGPQHPAVRIMERIERHLYRRAVGIVSLLPDAAAHMVDKGAAPEKIVWIPNGVDLRLVPPPQPPVEQEPFTVMYAGAHGVANGLDALIDAAALLQRDGYNERVRFRFIGDGPEKLRLQRRVQDEGIQCVYFEEPVPKAQVYQVLQEAHILIVTLRNLSLYRWGMSLNKLFDYLASARPIVFGADITSNPVAQSGGGLTVPPEDAAATAAAIKQLVAMPAAKRWEMGQRGRRFVEENHDHHRLAERLEGVLAAAVQAEAQHAPALPTWQEHLSDTQR